MFSADNLTINKLTELYPPYRDVVGLRRRAELAVESFTRTMVVLDDDPTGTQTVFGVPVITAWDEELLTGALRNAGKMLFILTNSRALTSAETEYLHRELGERLIRASIAAGKEILLISRSDSTLRGHFPLETITLKDTAERLENKAIDGEIICPFFLEGGRYTFGDTHYVLDGKKLIPAGESEFSKDKTFGYKNSHLGRWVEEKTGGAYTAQNCVYITMEDLRCEKRDVIREKLNSAAGFQKIIVNAVSYEDLYVFVPELLSVINSGKKFIMRTAASILKVMSGCFDSRWVKGRDICGEEKVNGGVVIVGSHVGKTTTQLERLLACAPYVEPIEFNQHLVLNNDAFENEIERVSRLATDYIVSGRDTVVYTRRDRLDVGGEDKEKELQLAVSISSGLVRVISSLNVKPKYIVAKGGITSSDVATKGLSIITADVMGQILPGIPVWSSGKESKFPGMPYVIFPGNVGDGDSLLEVVKILNS